MAIHGALSDTMASQEQTYPLRSMSPLSQRTYSSASRQPTSSSSTRPRPRTPPLLKTPSGQSFSAYLSHWGQPEVSQFLELYKCGHYMRSFETNNISGKILLDLDVGALKSMGVTKIGERVRLMSGIKDLRQRASERNGGRVYSAASQESANDIRMADEQQPYSSSLSGAGRSTDNGLDRAGSSSLASSFTRRPSGTRPPPLNLQQYSSSKQLPQAYQSTAVPSQSTLRTKQTLAHQQLDEVSQSQAAMHPEPLHRSGAAHAPNIGSSTQTSNLALRAPPRRDAGRRSPSPIYPDNGDLRDRPHPTESSHQRPSISVGDEVREKVSRPGQGEGFSPALGPAPTKGLPARPEMLPRKPSIISVTGPGSSSPGTASPGKPKFFTSQAGPKQIPVPPNQVRHPFAVRKQEFGRSAEVLEASAPGPIDRPVHTSLDRVRNRPATANTAPNGSALSLDDLRRQLVKFVNGEDGTIRTVNVTQASTGVEVLERALRKFGKWGTGMHTSTDTDSDDDHEGILEIDGWGVYTESNPGGGARPLSEADLFKICVAHRDGTAIRERNLFLHRARNLQKRKNIHEFFGEIPPPPMSPASPTFFPGPRLGISQDASGTSEHLTPSRSYNALNNRSTNRASMISVMSGLGVQLPDIPPSPSAALRSPSSGGSMFGYKKKSMYNFFGHRPPSELISNHLADYFPSAKKSDVEKARHSMLRVSSGANMYKKLVAGAPEGTLPEGRESIKPVPESTVLEQRPATSLGSQPPSLPPFEISQDSLTDSLQAYSSPPPNQTSRPKSTMTHRARRDSNASSRSRMSTLSYLRRNRDRSDTASLLTVDEITAEVENRRSSPIPMEDRVALQEGEEDSLGPAAPVDVKSDDDEGGTAEEDDVESESSEEEISSAEESEDSYQGESDSSQEDGDEEGAEQGKAYTSTGSKRIIKWMIGALIGAGSFGSVYLGMDSQSGLLMAVKRVELATGSSKNDERKRSMISALEREIELLKELQHDNIVQYLDSSVDKDHLNIFLEYVPGGSVAALLSNYGAFEEALVRNFVRQILTGLNYLHEREIIHRDIKGANVLVDNKGGIKISDFGISKKMESNLMTGIRANRPSLQGSVFWMAPEAVKQTSYTSKADIWSVGCLVVEMLTGTHPWADLTQMQAIFRIGSLARPATPSDISPEAADFLRRTFEIDHTKRPTAAQLLEHPFITSKRQSRIDMEEGAD